MGKILLFKKDSASSESKSLVEERTIQSPEEPKSILVEPTIIERVVEVIKEVEVEIIREVEKPVIVYVEKPVEKFIEIIKEVPIEVEKIIEKEVEIIKNVEIEVLKEIYKVPRWAFVVMAIEAILILIVRGL